MNFSQILKVLATLKPADYQEILAIANEGVALEQRVKKFVDAHPELMALFNQPQA